LLAVSSDYRRKLRNLTIVGGVAVGLFINARHLTGYYARDTFI